MQIENKINKLIMDSKKAKKNIDKINILIKAKNIIYTSTDLSYQKKIRYLKNIETISNEMHLPN